MIDILTKIGFDWHIALANFVNFLIIFYILNRFLFKPLAKVLAERKKVIADGVEKSAQADVVLRETEAERERILNESRQEANTIVSAAETTAVALKNKRAEEAEAQAGVILSEAKDTITKEKARLESEVKEKAVALVIASTEKVLREKIDATKNETLIKEALSGLKA